MRNQDLNIIEFPSRDMDEKFESFLQKGENFCVIVRNKRKARLIREKIETHLKRRPRSGSALKHAWDILRIQSFYSKAMRAKLLEGYDIEIKTGDTLKVYFLRPDTPREDLN